ncbi:hypothetical protein Q0Z83_022600 [Actinoplanes sichuanensis]|uniref:TerD domain-containing protein n=1 Tax=Actinoplanes sichuanensis TaxID=512349 RepID=A0ABW4AIQ2_9ACTN|nr:hypothetical protein [Actinoplanes sichuanensis]BEL04069.1 hypothetical protein Q0Z83_022600 [Actinoplanes sichuanensis]
MTALTEVPRHPMTGDTAEVRVAATSGKAQPIALLLDRRGRVTSEYDLVFAGMPAHPTGAAQYAGDTLRLTPSAAGEDIRRITVGLLRGPEATTEAEIHIFGTPFRHRAGAAEPVVLLAEFVREPDGGWSYQRAGYGLGSAALLVSRFRAEPDGTLQRRLTTHLAALYPAAAAPIAAPPSGLIVGSVSLDQGEHASVARSASLRAALDWSMRAKDLDLYALYVDVSGRSGVCYYRDQGSLSGPPYICLTSGDSRGRETLQVSRTDQFRYVLICAYSAVENGFGSFAAFHAFAEIDNGDGSVVQTPLRHRNRYSYWVAIALLDLTAPDRISVRHVERYSKPRSEARPALYPDGTFQMDAGPVEFKTR